MDLWHAVSEITVRARTGGIALPAKFQPSAIRQIDAVVSAGKIRVEFRNYTGEGRTGIFDEEGVCILGRDGRPLDWRKEPRDAFHAFRQRLFWDSLDALYFSGYALWNYLNLPFLLCRPDLMVKEGEPWGEDGEVWSRLIVSFPSSIPTHCRDQVFYFNRQGLLVRHDYTAEVFGKWAKACHYSWDHREVGGIIIPRKRRVHPRLPSNRPLRLVTLVSIGIEEIALRIRNR
jgi:hypothetical protein